MRSECGGRENPGSRTDHSRTSGYVGDHGRVGADDHIITHMHTTKDHCSGADIDPIADDRICAGASRTSRTDGHALCNGAIGAELAVKMNATEVTNIESRANFTVSRNTDAEQHLDEELEDSIDHFHRQRKPARTYGPAPASKSIYGNGQKTKLCSGCNPCSPGPVNGLHGDKVSLEVGSQWRLHWRFRWRLHWRLMGRFQRCVNFLIHEQVSRERSSSHPASCQPINPDVCSLTNIGAA